MQLNHVTTTWTVFQVSINKSHIYFSGPYCDLIALGSYLKIHLLTVYKVIKHHTDHVFTSIENGVLHC